MLVKNHSCLSKMAIVQAVFGVVALGLLIGCGSNQHALSSSIATSAEVDPATRDALVSSLRLVAARVDRLADGWSMVAGDDVDGNGSRWTLTGPGTSSRSTIVLLPPEGQSVWDFSEYSWFRIDATNAGTETVCLEARLDNANPQDWSNSSSSMVVILPGERATLGIPYPRSLDQDDTGDLFPRMNGKANGWRGHWKAFDPRQVRALQLRVYGSDAPVALNDVALSLAWPYGAPANAQYLQMPLVDSFGQYRHHDWPGRVTNADQMVERAVAEAHDWEQAGRPQAFNGYGGWADGPLLEATGYFRIEKIEGRWWLVDPDGRLFFSVGSNSVGYHAATGVTGREWLFPDLPEAGSPLHAAAVSSRRGADGPSVSVNYLAGNLIHKYGENADSMGREALHRRWSAWGLNTIGSWSDAKLYRDRRTPYTAMAGTYHPAETRAVGKLGDPFDPDFRNRIEQSLAGRSEESSTDAWCIGIFVDNELDWPGDLVHELLERPAAQPARVALIEQLQSSYADLAGLNAAWGSSFASWDALRRPAAPNEAYRRDTEIFYADFADRYYGQTAEAVREAMPNHLYLGSRIHTCPRVVAIQAARHVDVFTVNHYWPVAGTGSLPPDTDVPVMITEFHFGTVDRGVLGVSLYGVHDQKQRARGYARYLATALRHPNIVGVHWFAFPDQATTGRGDGENYQVGFVDITDTPYPEMVGMIRTIAEEMYDFRALPEGDVRADILRQVGRWSAAMPEWAERFEVVDDIDVIDDRARSLNGVSDE